MKCIGNDPLCPCQDGDVCHYVDHGDTKAMTIPDPIARMTHKIDVALRKFELHHQFMAGSDLHNE